MRRLCGGVLAMILVAQFGCGVIQKPSWNKPWGRGAMIPAAVCGLVGAGAGVAIQNERGGTSRLVIDSSTNPPTTITRRDDKELWKGAVVGFPIGAVVCGVLGHIFLDREEHIEIQVPPPSPTGEEGLPGGVAVRSKKRIVLRGVFFDFDRAGIRPDSKPVLDEAARILVAAGTDIEQLIVEGHTDSVGSEEYNKALSIRRAEAVYRYLVNAGVSPEAMRIEGYGESKPIADNDTAAGRADNRRVELRVIQRQIVPANQIPPGAELEESEQPEDKPGANDDGEDSDQAPDSAAEN